MREKESIGKFEAVFMTFNSTWRRTDEKVFLPKAGPVHLSFSGRRSRCTPAAVTVAAADLQATTMRPDQPTAADPSGSASLL